MVIDRKKFRSTGENSLALISSHVIEVKTVKSEAQQTNHRRRVLREKLRGVAANPLMRGSIVEKAVRCGKVNCACASDREARHKTTVVTVSMNGRPQTIPLRKEDEAQVRNAIEGYARAWKLINQLTECEFAELRREARERRRARKRRANN